MNVAYSRSPLPSRAVPWVGPPRWLVVATGLIAVCCLAMAVAETNLWMHYLIDDGEYVSLVGLAFVSVAGVHLHRSRRLLASLPLIVPWLLFPVIFHEIARRQGWLDRYARYIGALNWINLPGMTLAVVFIPLAQLAPKAVGDLVSIGLQGLFFYWFLVTTRQVLGVGWPLATMLLIVSWVPLAFISFLVARYLGVAAAVAV